MISPSKTLEEKDLEISRTIEAMRVKNLQLKSEIETLQSEDQNKPTRAPKQPINEAKYISKMQTLADEKKVLEKEMQLIENRIKHILAQNESMESEIQSYDVKARKVLEVKQKKIEWEKQLAMGKEAQKKQLTERRHELLVKDKQRQEDIGQRTSQKSTIESARSKALAKEREMQDSIRHKIAELDRVMFEQKQLQIEKMSKTHQTDQSHVEYLKKKERCDVLVEKTSEEDQRVAEMKSKLEQMKVLEQQMMESKKNTQTMKNNLKSRFQDILNGKMKEEEISRLLAEQQYNKSGVQRNSSYQKMMEKIAETHKKTPKKPSRATSKNSESPSDSKTKPSGRKSISNLGSGGSNALKRSQKDAGGTNESPESAKFESRMSSITASAAGQSSSDPKHKGAQPTSKTVEDKEESKQVSQVSEFKSREPEKQEVPRVDPVTVGVSRQAEHQDTKPSNSPILASIEVQERTSQPTDSKQESILEKETEVDLNKQPEKVVEDTPTLATDDVLNTTGAEGDSIQTETPATELSKPKDIQPEEQVQEPQQPQTQVQEPQNEASVPVEEQTEHAEPAATEGASITRDQEESAPLELVEEPVTEPVNQTETPEQTTGGEDHHVPEVQEAAPTGTHPVEEQVAGAQDAEDSLDLQESTDHPVQEPVTPEISNPEPVESQTTADPVAQQTAPVEDDEEIQLEDDEAN